MADVTGGNIVYNLIANVQSATSGFKQVQDQIKQTRDSITNFTTSMAQISLAISTPLTALLKWGLDFDATMERAQLTFEAFYDDAKKGKDIIEGLQNISLTSTSQITWLNQFATQLTAWGFAAENILPITKDIVNSMSAMGIAPEKLTNVASVLGRMRDMGVLNLKEIGVMLTSGGAPGIMKYLEKGLGLEAGSVGALTQKRAISGKEALGAIFKGLETDPHLKNMAQKQAQTFYGMITVIKDYAQQTLGKLELPLFASIENGMKMVINVLKTFAQYVDKMSGPMKTLIVGLAALLAVGPPLALALSLVSKGVLSLISIAFNPWIASISLLVGAITYLTVTNDKFREGMVDVWNKIAKSANEQIPALNDMLMDLKPVFSDLTDSTATFGKVFIATLSGIVEATKIAVPTMMDSLKMVGGFIDGVIFKFMSLGVKQLSLEGLFKRYYPGLGGADEAKNNELLKQYSAEADKYFKMSKNSLDNLMNPNNESGKNIFDNAIDNIKSSMQDYDKIINPVKEGVKNTINSFNGITVKLPTISNEQVKKGIDEAKKYVDAIKKFDINAEGLEDKGKDTADKLKEYVNKIQTEAKRYMDALSLFANPQLEGTRSPARLEHFLDKQLKIMERFKAAIEKIRARGGEGSEALVTALLQAGPTAERQATSLANAANLSSYEKKFNQKWGLSLELGAQAEVGRTKQANAINIYITGNEIKSELDVNQIANSMVKHLKSVGM